MIRLMKTYSSARTPGSSKVKKVPLLLFAIALLLAGGAAAVRAQCALDGFDPNANSVIFAVAVQPDGKVLIGGQFTTLSPNGGAAVPSHFIARLNPDGTLDTGFYPNPNYYVHAIALQADGSVLAGGSFTTIGGQTRTNIARLDATTGAADSFAPNANSAVNAIVVQGDGKILVGGTFSSAISTPTIGGQTRNRIARLDPVTGLADSFDPNANSTVSAIAVQADGKILVGGSFGAGSSIGGQTRYCLARLNATNGLADSFDPDVGGGNSINKIVVQADAKILIGGGFATLSPNGGATVTRNCIARLEGTPLNIQFSANRNVLLSWATNFTGFTLEVSTNLNTNVWSVVSPPPVVSGTFNVVTNSASGPPRFYRLRQ